MNILLSGFNPFGNLEINPSQAIVEEIKKRWTSERGSNLTTEILPTEYAAAEDRIRNLVREIRPDAILCLGVNEMVSSINLERVAINYDDEWAPDNAGEVRRGQRIIADGPPAYWSTLPLEHIRDVLHEEGVPVEFSNHAGTYVCNHVFYASLHELKLLNLEVPCGFIHVPSILEQSSERNQVRNGLPLEVMVPAIERCLESILNHATKSIRVN